MLPPGLKKIQEENTKQADRYRKYAPLLIHLGVGRLLFRNRIVRGNPPNDLGEEILYLGLQSKNFNAIVGELESFDESAKQVRAAGILDNKPLVVLTAGKNIDDSQKREGTSKKDFEDFRTLWVNDLQMREAHLSTRGNRIIVPDSGHMIPYERPDTIVSAVRDVCAAVRSPVAAALPSPAK